MNLKNEFNRLSGYFSEGVEKVQTATCDVGEKVRTHASDVTGRARATMREGTGTLFSAEETLISHIRQNPMLYIFSGLLLVGALIAKTMLSERTPPRRLQW